MNSQNETKQSKSSFKTWLARLGFAGFMFFFIKGLIWLAIFLSPFIIGYSLW